MHFVDPLVPSVLDFELLWPRVSKPEWIYHHLSTLSIARNDPQSFVGPGMQSGLSHPL